MIKNLVKYVKGKRSKIVLIERLITRENSNWLELFVGESGSGKTWCALEDCYERDKDFDVEKQLVFDFKTFMELINSDWFKKKKLKQIIFDEPQTSISNRQWQSLVNRLFNYLLTTFRHQNIVVLFCTPYRDFLDSASMKMIHCMTEMVSIDRKRKRVKTKPKIQQYNSKKQKTYDHTIHVIRDGQVFKMVFDYIPKPPQHMVDKYEEMKTIFTSKLNKGIQAQLLELEMKETPKKTGKELTEKQIEVLNLMKEHNDKKKVAKILGIKLPVVYDHLKLSKNKGHTPENWNMKAN